MKKMIVKYWVWFIVMFMVAPVHAQQYDDLWKEAEELQKKDLPQSVIAVANRLMEKATAEKNTPQLMKAFLFRAEWKTALSPDSAEIEISRLREWEKNETNAIDKAVLASLCGSYALQKSPADVTVALQYFKASLKERESLLKVSSEAYKPMTESGKWSQHYGKDNLYDLLVHQAIRSLLADVNMRRNAEVRQEVLAMYSGLISVYATDNPSADLFTRLEMLPYRLNAYALSSYYPEQQDSAIVCLNAWIKEYEGTEVCAEAYRQLAMCYENTDRVKQLALAQEGLQRYPDTPFSDGLKSMIAQIKAPELSVNFVYNYPGDEAAAHVVHRNVKGFTCTIYRLKGEPSDFWHTYKPEKELLKNKGKQLYQQHFGLQVPTDYQPKDTTVRVQLPQAGTYLVELLPDGYRAAASYKVMHLSALMGLAVTQAASDFVITDSKSGHPVPNGWMELYSRDASGFRLYKTLKADENGQLQVKREDLKGYFVRFCTDTDKGMEPLTAYTPWWTPRSGENAEQLRTVLFTDRGLYRPGQMVRLTGRVYRQYGDKTQVAENVERELELRDANGRSLQKKQVRTDEFGAFSVDFVLPESVLPGRFGISTKDGSCSFQVEAYKLPTFRVDFLPYTRSYLPGDTVTVEAEAINFTGVPLRLCRVNYRVLRSLNFWVRNSEEGEVLASGTTQTDVDGHFYIEAPLTAFPDNGDVWRNYYLYKVVAEVTGENGETQTGFLNLPVGESSLIIRINGLTARVVKEKQEKIQFLVMNLNEEQVEASVRYKVFELDEKGNVGREVLSAATAQSEAFVPGDLLRMPSGRYRLVATVTDEQGRESKAEEDFILFSLQDRIPPVKESEWFYQDGTEWKENAVPALYIGSSEQDVYCYYRVYSGEKLLEKKVMRLNNEIRKIAFPYKEAYGKGISVVYAFVKNGVTYGRTATIVCPQPDKRLVLKWESFRDELTPGSKEEWKLRVSSPDGAKADASLLATLYDASLDQLYPYQWQFRLYFSRQLPWISYNSYFGNSYTSLHVQFPPLPSYQGVNAWSEMQDRLYVPALLGRRGWYGGGIMARANTMMKSAVASAPLAESKVLDSVEESGTVTDVIFEEEVVSDLAGNPENALPASGSPSLRSNFAETAFFYPALRTDSNGVAVLSFTVPERLTEWKLMAMAHTKDMDYGLLTDKAVSRKELMIRPNLPRFIRKGDKVSIPAVIQNLSMNVLKGKATLELTDAVSGKSVYRKSVSFTVDDGANQAVNFSFVVPDAYDLLVCKVMAVTDVLSDGEQHYLPVLSDREWVTETVSVQVEPNRTQQVDMRTLFNGQSNSAGHKRVTVELTANPEWYVLQALPVLGEPLQEDALSWGTALYANALAVKIVQDNPQLKQVLDSWLQHPDELKSPLEKNEELKTLLLQETPWLMEGQHESERRKQLAMLADVNTMQYRLQLALRKLREQQLADGSWGWYKGMMGSRYITTQLAVGMARLKAMGVSLVSLEIEPMYQQALRYLSKEVHLDYERLLEQRAKGQHDLKLWNEQILNYLYIGSLDKAAMQLLDKSVQNELVKALLEHPAACSIAEKAVIAQILHACGQQAEAAVWLQSVKEYLVSTPAMGSYFDTPKAAYTWRSYRIPTHVAAMEAIRIIQPDEQLLNAMKRWLLKQKQVQCWESPIASADAVFAFISTGTAFTDTAAHLDMTWGSEKLKVSSAATGTYSGYVKRSYPVKGTSATTLAIKNSGEKMGWGAVYVQYSEKPEKLAARGTEGLSVVRELLSDNRVVDGTSLHVGDKITVRLTIRADRDMDFVQVIDRRASCMEPGGTLSGYVSRKGMGYYQVHKDTSSEFFIDKLTKGVHVIEYTVYIDRKGTYQQGTASVQSAYAPEWIARINGETLTVE